MSGRADLVAKTWRQESVDVAIAQQAPRGVGSRRAAQALSTKFDSRVAKAARANGIAWTSQYATVEALDAAGVPNV